MISGKDIKIFLLAGIFAFFGIFLFSAVTEAQVMYNLRGKAYWGNLGYIYFNCLDASIGNRLDEPENLAGAGRYLPPNDLFHFYADACADPYVVQINANGRFYGRAWNENLGWINFEGLDAPNFGFNSGCSAASCTSGSGCIACFNFDEQRAYGWARVASTGEYISLNDKDNKGLDNANVVRAWTKASDRIFPLADGLLLGDFAGRAAMNSGEKPNIHFNCLTENYPALGTCATRNYKVYIENLILGRLTAPNWTYSQACAGDALTAVLRWEKLSGTQTAYEIVVSENDVLSTSTGEFACWSGKKSGTSLQYIISNANPDCGNRLKYGTNYYWWLRGYDGEDMPTNWIQYDSNSLTSTDGNPDNNPLTFTTFKHRFPNPFFTWSPLEVTTATTTTFTSESFVYSSSSPDVPQLCVDNPELCTGFQWTTTDINALITNPNDPITDITFQKATNTAVTLAVTDASGYVCSLSRTIRINFGLPLWREVKAE